MFVVLEIISSDGIEPQHPQVGRQPSHVDVQDEARVTQRSRSQGQQRTDVERLEHRNHADAVAILHTIRERLRLAIYQDQIDLGVRRTWGLYQVLDRRRSMDRADEGTGGGA